MDWFWYIGNDFEVFADLDLSRKSMKRLSVSRARILGAIKDEKLQIYKHAYFESSTKYHYHLMINCRKPMSEIERLMWESRFCDDMFRNSLNMARFISGGKSWSLLISSDKRNWREPDFTCQCPGKHKEEIMKNCPVALKLDCCLSADYFGTPIYSEEKITLGKVERVFP